MMLGKFLATHLPAIYNIITLGIERNEFIVTDETRIVPGVTTTVVWDRVWLDNELIEETYDWYAQDRGGNVWYFGEDSKQYENRRLLSTKGCGEAGVDGAKPRIIIEGNPKVVDSYKQEYYKGEAEDMGDVVALGEMVTVRYGHPRSGAVKSKSAGFTEALNHMPAEYAHR